MRDRDDELVRVPQPVRRFHDGAILIHERQPGEVEHRRLVA